MNPTFFRQWIGGLMFAAVLLSGRNLAAEPKARFSLTTAPRFCLTSCTVRVRITVPRHQDNRSVTLSWADVFVASGYAGSSRINLNGDDEVVYFERYIEDLPEGVYNIAVTLHRNSSDRAYAYAESLAYVGISPQVVESETAANDPLLDQGSLGPRP